MNPFEYRITGTPARLAMFISEIETSKMLEIIILADDESKIKEYGELIDRQQKEIDNDPNHPIRKNGLHFNPELGDAGYEGSTISSTSAFSSSDDGVISYFNPILGDSVFSQELSNPHEKTIYLENPLSSQSVLDKLIQEIGFDTFDDEWMEKAGKWFDKEFGVKFGKMWRAMRKPITPWKPYNSTEYQHLSNEVKDDPDYLKAVQRYDALDKLLPCPPPMPQEV